MSETITQEKHLNSMNIPVFIDRFDFQNLRVTEILNDAYFLSNDNGGAITLADLTKMKAIYRGKRQNGDFPDPIYDIEDAITELEGVIKKKLKDKNNHLKSSSDARQLMATNQDNLIADPKIFLGSLTESELLDGGNPLDVKMQESSSEYNSSPLYQQLKRNLLKK